MLFLSGYDLSVPGIGLGVLVSPFLPTCHHIPPLPRSELELVTIFPVHERFEPSICLGSLAPSPLRPTCTIPPVPFFRICFFVAWDLKHTEPGMG